MSDSLKDTIIPKSDQLNADDLLCGPITVTIESVKRGDKEQPVSISIKDHQPRQPYKPCKSMRRVLIAAWGDQGKDWVGKSMTLYCDPSVSFGGVKVGGIRISHMSHIDGDKTFMLTASRGKKGEFKVKKLEQSADAAALASFTERITKAGTLAALDEIATELKTQDVGIKQNPSIRKLWGDRKKQIEELAGLVKAKEAEIKKQMPDYDAEERAAAAREGNQF